MATFLGEANLFEGEVAELDGQTGLARAVGPAGLTSVAAAAPVGTSVTLVERPEDVQIARSGGGQVGLEAIVETMAFTGDSIRVELTADGRTPITARLPKTMADPPRVGTVVKIWWREQMRPS